MRKSWEKPELSNLSVEETKSEFHYHCGSCGAAIEASIIESAPEEDYLTKWICPKCGAKDANYGWGCRVDHPVVNLS